MESWQMADKLYSLSNRELSTVVEECRLDLQRINVENTVFERFINTHEPSLLDRLVRTMKKVQDMYSKTAAESLRTAQMSESRIAQTAETLSLPSQGEAAGIYRMSRGPRINISQKTDLIMRVMDEIQTSAHEFTKKMHSKKCKLMAEIEETAIRDGELKEAMNSFEQTVVIEGVEALTQKIPAEKFVRYMQEWLKLAQVTLEKLRLRTSSLRTQHHKLKILLTQKEEMGECVHEVDFEKLHIENRNFQLIVEQVNKHLIELKQMNGRANFLMTTNKNFLQKQQVMMDEIRESIKFTVSETAELEKEYNKTEIALEKYRIKFDRLSQVLNKYSVPDIMEYIIKKAELAEMKKSLKVWQRKRNIQKISMATCTRTMCQLTGWHNPKASWFESTISTPDSIKTEASKALSFVEPGSPAKHEHDITGPPETLPAL